MDDAASNENARKPANKAPLQLRNFANLTMALYSTAFCGEPVDYCARPGTRDERTTPLRGSAFSAKRSISPFEMPRLRGGRTVGGFPNPTYHLAQ